MENEEISFLKRKLVIQYLIVMTVILSLYNLYFITIVKNTLMSYYLTFGIITLSIFLYVTKRSSNLEKLITVYICSFLFYSLGIMLLFWRHSVASFIWLLPIPIAVYIFFDLKKIYQYSVFILGTILTFTIIAYYYPPSYHIHMSPDQIRLSDIFIIICNIIIFTHLLYYKFKINLLTVQNPQIIYKERTPLKNILKKNDRDLEREKEKYGEIFTQIEQIMIEEKLYKNTNLNISLLSTKLKISNSYISRSIKTNGFNNFNSYINNHRIKYVETIINSTDFERLTMLYIYSEAGFKSQSTFNRVFKEIKGITPSEYITSLQRE